MAERPGAKATVALVGLTALGALLRFSTLDLQSYWYDEVQTVHVLEQALAPLNKLETSPPLYFLVALGWSRLFGTGEVGLRSLSALAGTVTIPVAYAAARALVNVRAGVITAALVAVSPILVWYSQEARSYALLVVLAAISLWCFARARDGGRRWIAGWAVASVLALATHYFAVFVVAAEALLLARLPARRTVLVGVGAAVLAVAALLPLALRQAGSASLGLIASETVPYRIVHAVTSFVGAPQGNPVPALVVASGVLACVAIALGVASALREHPGVRVVGAIAVFALVVPLLLAVAGVDYFLPRNLIAVWIPVAIVAAAGCASRRAGRLGTSLAVAMCAVLLAIDVAVWVTPEKHREGWRGAAEAMGPVREPRVVFVTPGFGALALGHYAPGLRALPQRGKSVREIVFVSVLPRGPFPILEAGRFKPSEIRYPPRLVVIRYRVRSPIPVTPAAAALVSPRGLRGKHRSVVLYQAPSGSLVRPGGPGRLG